MRILHVTPYYEPAWAYGGSVRVAAELCPRLVERGHDVTVLTTDALDHERRAESGERAINGVRVVRVRNRSNRLAWRRVFMPVGFKREARKMISEADVVHVHEVRSLLNAAVLPTLLGEGMPYIVMPHGGLPRELGRTPYKVVYDWLWGERLIARACRLHALTEMEREQHVVMGIPREKTVLIPNGIDVEAFDMDADVQNFRARYAIPVNAPVVGFLGRLNTIKGLDFLVESFARVLTAHPGAVLMLAGPDDGARSVLEAQIRRLGIGKSVRFTGMMTGAEDKAAAYRAFDVYVLPSRYDAQGITVLEALLNGTPCITSDRCGLATWLVEEEIGQVVGYGATEELAKAIEVVLADRELAKRQAERGKRIVKETFDWETATDRWVDVYQTCIDEAAD